MIFREVGDRLQRTAEALSNSSSQVRRTILQLDWQARGLNEATATAEELLQIQQEATKSLTASPTWPERHEIVFYRFQSARRIVGEEYSPLWDAYTNLTREIGIFLPFEGGPKPHPFRPDAAKLEELSRLADSYHTITGNFSGYVLYLRIEAQIILLGGLFGRTLAPRNPLDTSVKVLKSDVDVAPTRRPARGNDAREQADAGHPHRVHGEPGHARGADHRPLPAPVATV